MPKVESHNCSACKEEATWYQLWRAGQYDDWGQYEYYCEEHLKSAKHRSGGTFFKIINNTQNLPKLK